MRRPVDRSWILDSLPPERTPTEGARRAFPFLVPLVVVLVAGFMYVQAAFMLAVGVFLGGAAAYRTTTGAKRR